MIYASLSAYLYIVGMVPITLMIAGDNNKQLDEFGLDEWSDVVFWPILMPITLIAAWWNE